ncbi:MAG: hypothetical protein MUP22_14700 [Desulfobacterales bacterium]|nr:hypothetical protein [Desulfobacterales bacterium]
MKKALLFIMIGLVCGVFLTSCGSPKYVHKDPVFSYEYPMGYKQEPLAGGAEVARFANQNQYKIPVYTASVVDKVAGVKLSDVTEGVIATMEKDNPGSSRYKVIAQNLVKLSDGSDALAWTLKWRWIDGVTYLQTALVCAYQGDKLITIAGTTMFGGDTPLDKLLEQCMTLTLTP